MAENLTAGWARKEGDGAHGRWRRVIRRAPSGRISAAADAAVVEAHAGLARDLAAAVEGEVRFDRGSRALYATDSSN